MANAPTSLTLRVYNVGFGDCFLLTFHYAGAGKDRHILIDFGSKAHPVGSVKNLMPAIAANIKKECGDKLHAIVVTHRHEDHIKGFSTNKAHTAPGDVIASCKPDLIVQPWTEDPKAQKDALEPTKALQPAIAPQPGNPLPLTAAEPPDPDKRFLQALHYSDAISYGIVAEAKRLLAADPASKQRRIFEALKSIGEENIKNRSAVDNLQRMGRNEYIFHGAKTGLSQILPGVKITVLGPPTLKQSDKIRKERDEDANEFWMFQANAARFTSGRLGIEAAKARGAESARAGEGGAPDDGDWDEDEDAEPPHPPRLFKDAETLSADNPPNYARWFMPRLRAIRGDNLLQIVRILDDQMNNTSLILLFEVGDQMLLFPGDAQIENWEHTLGQPDLMKRLKNVTLYKVGHHGSRNATPKSLWKVFDKRKDKAGGSDPLKTVMSTMIDVYGQIAEHSEVPRASLVTELKKKSKFFTTQSLPAKELRGKIEIQF